MDGGLTLLAKYLFFLLPFIYLQYVAADRRNARDPGDLRN